MLGISMVDKNGLLVISLLEVGNGTSLRLTFSFAVDKAKDDWYGGAVDFAIGTIGATGLDGSENELLDVCAWLHTWFGEDDASWFADRARYGRCYASANVRSGGSAIGTINWLPSDVDVVVWYVSFGGFAIDENGKKEGFVVYEKRCERRWLLHVVIVEEEIGLGFGHLVVSTLGQREFCEVRG
jgi:hypothetical protein